MATDYTQHPLYQQYFDAYSNKYEQEAQAVEDAKPKKAGVGQAVAGIAAPIAAKYLGGQLVSAMGGQGLASGLGGLVGLGGSGTAATGAMSGAGTLMGGLGGGAASGLAGTAGAAGGSAIGGGGGMMGGLGAGGAGSAGGFGGLGAMAPVAGVGAVIAAPMLAKMAWGMLEDHLGRNDYTGRQLMPELDNYAIARQFGMEDAPASEVDKLVRLAREADMLRTPGRTNFESGETGRTEAGYITVPAYKSKGVGVANGNLDLGNSAFKSGLGGVFFDYDKVKHAMDIGPREFAKRPELDAFMSQLEGMRGMTAGEGQTRAGDLRGRAEELLTYNPDGPKPLVGMSNKMKAGIFDSSSGIDVGENDLQYYLADLDRFQNMTDFNSGMPQAAQLPTTNTGDEMIGPQATTRPLTDETLGSIGSILAGGGDVQNPIRVTQGMPSLPMPEGGLGGFDWQNIQTLPGQLLDPGFTPNGADVGGILGANDLVGRFDGSNFDPGLLSKIGDALGSAVPDLRTDTLSPGIGLDGQRIIY